MNRKAERTITMTRIEALKRLHCERMKQAQAILPGSKLQRIMDNKCLSYAYLESETGVNRGSIFNITNEYKPERPARERLKAYLETV